MGPLYRRLHFPERAENLKQFSSYQVRLDHWGPLAAPFEDAFTKVYERGSSAVLLIHGAQGSGKTLFCDRLQRDFEGATQGALAPRVDNLWHTLVGGSPPALDTITKATGGAALRRVRSEEGWLTRERAFATQDERYKVRIFLLDDAHGEFVLCDLAKIDLHWFRSRPRREAELAVLGGVAQNLVSECRGDFQRSIFVLASNRAELMAGLREEIERSHAGLATIQELPLPVAEVKEAIVRTNTNLLNSVSYWYCLDQAGPEEKKKVHMVLHAQQGFTDSFLAVDEALKTTRSGRPAHLNVLTLVTLGSEPLDAKAFLGEHGIDAVEEHLGEHLGVFFARDQWASQLAVGADATRARRAELVQSEFALRWIALGLRGAFELCRRPTPKDRGEGILEVIRFFPSYSPAEQARQRSAYQALEAALADDADAGLAAWSQTFQNLGQRRNTIYEPAIAARVGGAYNHGFAVLGSVRPDLILAEYSPCAVTAAATAADIGEAIKRTCHAVEFTSFLGPQMKGLAGYVLGKVESYAVLLESV